MGKKNPAKKLGKEFKDFITKGNVISLAIGVIIGGAFQAVVNSMVNDIFMPLIGMFTKGIDFSKAFLDLSRLWDPELPVIAGIEAAKAAEPARVVMSYGVLITALINFLIIALVVFFIVKALTSVGDASKKLAKKAKKGEAPEPEPEPEPPTTKECPFCCSEIAIKASRCPNCTSEQPEPEEEEKEIES